MVALSQIRGIFVMLPSCGCSDFYRLSTRCEAPVEKRFPLDTNTVYLKWQWWLNLSHCPNTYEPNWLMNWKMQVALEVPSPQRTCCTFSFRASSFLVAMEWRRTWDVHSQHGVGGSVSTKIATTHLHCLSWMYISSVLGPKIPCKIKIHLNLCF